MDTCTCMCSSAHSCGCVADGGDAIITMCTRHPDLVSLDFYAIPIFPFKFLHLLYLYNGGDAMAAFCVLLL